MGETNVSNEKPQPKFQGAAKQGQKGLIQDLYNRIARSPETGEKVAYTFVVPGAQELLRSFDIQSIALPEIQALQCATKGVAGNYIAKAQEAGYSDDICGYVHVDVGLMESGMQHPLGKIPPPDVIICPTLCNTFIKWAEIWQERFNAPLLLIDVPCHVHNLDNYWGSEQFKHDRRFMVSQLQDIIAELERITGKKFDPDKLAEVQAKWNRVTDVWAEIRELNKRIPAVWDAHEDALYFMGAGIPYRGTDVPVEYFEAVKKELEERVELGLRTAASEKFRLAIHLAPCWAKLPQFIDLFKKRDAVFVWSTYSDLVSDILFRYDTSRPLESLAESFLMHNVRGDGWRSFDRMLQIEKESEEFKVDGFVLHTIKSCRLASTAVADYRNRLQARGMPTVLIESDLVDGRYFSDAQMRNRIDAFLEALEHKKLTRAVGGEAVAKEAP